MNKNFYFFPITIESLDEGGFLASCATLQGCRAEGESYAEAIENIQDVIKVHLDARREHNEAVPQISVPEKTDFRLTLPLPISL